MRKLNVNKSWMTFRLFFLEMFCVCIHVGYSVLQTMFRRTCIYLSSYTRCSFPFLLEWILWVVGPWSESAFWTVFGYWQISMLRLIKVKTCSAAFDLILHRIIGCPSSLVAEGCGTRTASQEGHGNGVSRFWLADIGQTLSVTARQLLLCTVRKSAERFFAMNACVTRRRNYCARCRENVRRVQNAGLSRQFTRIDE